MATTETSSEGSERARDRRAIRPRRLRRSPRPRESGRRNQARDEERAVLRLVELGSSGLRGASGAMHRPRHGHDVLRSIRMPCEDEPCALAGCPGSPYPPSPTPASSSSSGGSGGFDIAAHASSRDAAALVDLCDSESALHPVQDISGSARKTIHFAFISHPPGRERRSTHNARDRSRRLDDRAYGGRRVFAAGLRSRDAFVAATLRRGDHGYTGVMADPRFAVSRACAPRTPPSTRNRCRAEFARRNAIVRVTRNHC